jgi:hypothetical protein
MENQVKQQGFVFCGRRESFLVGYQANSSFAPKIGIDFLARPMGVSQSVSF